MKPQETDAARAERLRTQQQERAMGEAVKYGMYALPELINGKPVIAACRLPDKQGFMKGCHVVICREVSHITRANEDHGRINHAHVVWTVWPDGTARDGWTAWRGNYDMPLDRALAEFTRRVISG
jgi:hypothetical protein